MNRRAALLGTTAVAAGLGTGGYLTWSSNANAAWRDQVNAARLAIVQSHSGPDHLAELVRYGTLAANSHNTQAWRFVLGDSSITVEPDFSRRTPNVDPDDHHLFASIGAAVENIVQAAPLLGFSAEVRVSPDGSGRVLIALQPAATQTSAMAEAIPRRQCTRSLYDGRAVPAPDLQAIASAAGDDRVEMILITERAAIDAVGALVIEGNTVQMNDPAYIDELKQWLRFSYSEAVASGDGLFSAASGNPVMPGFVGRLLFPIVATADLENAKYLDQIASSAGLAIFVAAQDDKAHWVAAGRSYERFALQATALGVKHAFLNQAVEVPFVRQLLAEHLKLDGRRPDLIVRFGYAPDMPSSMRRPLSDVIA